MAQERARPALVRVWVVSTLAVACGATPSPSPLTGRWSDGIPETASVDPARGLDQPYGVFVELRAGGGFFSLSILNDAGTVFAETIQGTYAEQDGGALSVTGTRTFTVWAQLPDGGLASSPTEISSVGAQGYWGVAPIAAPPLLFVSQALTAADTAGSTTGYVLPRLDAPAALPKLLNPSPLFGSWTGPSAYYGYQLEFEFNADGGFSGTSSGSGEFHCSSDTCTYTETLALLGAFLPAYPIGSVWLPAATLTDSFLDTVCSAGECDTVPSSSTQADLTAFLRVELNADDAGCTVEVLGPQGPAVVDWAALFPASLTRAASP